MEPRSSKDFRLLRLAMDERKSAGFHVCGKGWPMIEQTIEHTRDLLREIWDVDRVESPPPAVIQGVDRWVTRLSNLGSVILYALLIGYGLSRLISALPESWRTSTLQLRENWWFWCGGLLLSVMCLRLGLELTKTFKRWNVANLLGVALLFDLILKKGPPLFGCEGISPLDSLFGVLETGGWHELFQKAMGL